MSMALHGPNAAAEWKHPIPSAAMKESMAIVGRTGSGKTYAARGAVERLLSANARVCIIDPTSVWWGLRSSEDGKRDGFPVVIFGGPHNDIAIDDIAADGQQGAALGKFVATTNVSTIIDLADFTRAGMTRFMQAFLDALYRDNKAPLYLIIDEADLFAPQRVEPETMKLLGRMEQIVRRGRVRGFRAWMITQRPASLNKNCLSQANTLIAMQLTAPQDRDAVGDWIEGQADKEEGKRILAALPKLKKGEGYVWSPSHDVLHSAIFPKITTFDSGRTPDDDEVLDPKKRAPVNIDVLAKQLQAMVLEQRDNDPKLLRAEIDRLATEIRTLKERKAPPSSDMLHDAYERGHAEGKGAAIVALRTGIDALWQDVNDDIIALSIREAHATGEDLETIAKQRHDEREPPLHINTCRKPPPAGTPSLPEGERAILTALVQHFDGGCTREQLSILTGYKQSTRNAYIQRLSARDYLHFDDGKVFATKAGRAALGNPTPLPRGRALLAHWLTKLPEGESKILRYVSDCYPQTIARDTISAQTGFKSSTRNAYIQRLRTRRLIDIDGAGVRASQHLF